ncbi:MAG: CHASE2 domain-containing protein [Halobacteriovoraceae bacterium]|nr:CHASE2 domain-containing protein [Halobacteriovoraceae bacterium]
MKKVIEKVKALEISKYYPLFFTVIFIFILLQYSFVTLDSIFYDYWAQLDIGVGNQAPIVVVTLDEESDQFLGEKYPYAFATHTRFIKELKKDNPKILSYFVDFDTPINHVEEKFLKEFRQELLEFKDKGGDLRFSTIIGGEVEYFPITGLRDLGHSFGALMVDFQEFGKDEVMRRATLNVSGEDTLHLWTANRYREFKKEPVLSPNLIQGAYYSPEKDATFALFRYFTSPVEDEGNILTIPYHRVLVGNFPKGLFKDKIVLVGPKYLAERNEYLKTPFNTSNFDAPKMHIHAAIIQALITNKTILQIPNMVTNIIAILVSIFLSYLISRFQPARGLFITMLIFLSFFLLSYLLFVGFGVWFRISHIIISIFAVYYIWVPFRAMTEYQTRYKIEEETKILQRVDMLKQNFISLMSHDLKTPVAKISGIADILYVQYDNEPRQKELLQNIISSTKELNSFINSILDLTKIESRNLTLNKSNKDVNQLIEGIVGKLAYEAKTKKIDLSTELEPLYPIEVDVVLINRVLSNLVENALKYSGEGTSVLVRTWDDEKWVHIEISDTGVGIKPEDLEHIFDKFYRVKNDSTHKIKGSGLGLYLVKYFVELHNGEISVKSKQGEGTTFTIKLVNA